MYEDTPAVFSAGFVEQDGKIAEKVLRKTSLSHSKRSSHRNISQGPSFLFIGVEMRYNTPQHIDSEIAKLDPDLYQVVSVPQFMELVRENHAG